MYLWIDFLKIVYRCFMYCVKTGLRQLQYLFIVFEYRGVRGRGQKSKSFSRVIRGWGERKARERTRFCPGPSV